MQASCCAASILCTSIPQEVREGGVKGDEEWKGEERRGESMRGDEG
jgi:hypothetical protein